MQGYRFRHRLRVRYSEVDAAQIVFHPHYLTYFDITASEYFTEGLKVPRAAHNGEGMASYVMRKTTVDFESPATVDDRLDIWCRVAEVGATSFTMEFVITREGEGRPLVRARNVMVSYNFVKNEVQPVPDFLRRAIEEFEAGVHEI